MQYGTFLFPWNSQKDLFDLKAINHLDWQWIQEKVRFTQLSMAEQVAKSKDPGSPRN